MTLAHDSLLSSNCLSSQVSVPSGQSGNCKCFPITPCSQHPVLGPAHLLLGGRSQTDGQQPRGGKTNPRQTDTRQMISLVTCRERDHKLEHRNGSGSAPTPSSLSTHSHPHSPELRGRQHPNGRGVRNAMRNPCPEVLAQPVEWQLGENQEGLW